MIPTTIRLVDATSSIMLFESASSGYAVATIGGDLPAISSSYAGYTLQVANSAPYSASWVAVPNVTVTNAVSSSFAATASSADNLTVRGTLTAQTINVQTITSSIDFVTGSTRNGSIAGNTHQFTGSVLMSGSLTVGGAATFSGDVSVNSTNSKTGGTAWNLNIRDNTALAANVGGGISFQGVYTTGGSIGNFGAISSYKTNATSGNESGGLKFYYSANGIITQGLQISETGKATFALDMLVTADITSNYGIAAARNGSNTQGSGPYFLLSNAAFNQLWYQQLNASNGIDYWYNGSIRMSITSGGNVNIGRTTDSTGNNGTGTTIYSNGQIYITANGSQTMLLTRTSSDGKILIFYKDASEVGSISTNTYSLPSDLNFKKNINNLTLGLNLVDKLRPVSYNHKIDDEDTALSTGFIAQELEQSLTELGINKNEYYILQHKPNEDKTQSQYWLDYTKMIPVLVKAIQELSAQNDTLKEILQRNNIQ